VKAAVFVISITACRKWPRYFRPDKARVLRAQATYKETIMRTVSVITIILATLSLSTIGAHAATWCAHYGGFGGTNCGFHSFEQCQAALSGNGGFCSRG
jgi:hypothetical protein